MRDSIGGDVGGSRGEDIGEDVGDGIGERRCEAVVGDVREPIGDAHVT